MSGALLLGCLWVVAAAVTAMLPYQRQFPPGITLLIAAPLILVWIGWVHGWLWLGIGALAVGSMFRRPLWYLGRKALGLNEQNQEDAR